MMSQSNSTEQFFSCSEDERPGSELDLGDPQRKDKISKSEETSNKDGDPCSSPLPPHRTEDMTTQSKDGNPPTRFLQLSSETAAADRDSATTPLVRSSSRVSKVQTTRWRWLMLFIFSLNMAVRSNVMSTFVPSDHVLECYYKPHDSRWVKHLAVYDTVIQALLLLPSAWMLVRYELKFTVTFASCATALGTALRLIGANSEYFVALVAGQLVSSFSSLMLVSVTFFSAVWFPHTERTTSTAISAVVGPQLGVIFSYAFGPLFILRSDNITNSSWCERDFPNWRYYLMGQALFSFVVFFVTVTVFRMAPSNPPSLSRRLEINARSADVTFCEQLKAYLTSFLELGRNYFFLFLLPAGIVIGASGSLVPLLNQIIYTTTTKNSDIHFQGTNQEFAFLEITGSICSIVAAILIAVLLDRTKLFYYLSLIIYAVVVLSVTAFATVVYFYVCLKADLHLVSFYITVGLVGASVSAFKVHGLEYSAEMTFPIPEGTSAAVFYFIGTILSLIMRVLLNELLSDKVYIVVWVITGLTIVGFMLLWLVKPELNRKKIEQKSRPSHGPTECVL